MGLAVRDYKDVNNGSLLLGGKNGYYTWFRCRNF